MTEQVDDTLMSLADIYGAPIEVDVDGIKVMLGPSTPGDAAGLDRWIRYERAWDYYQHLMAKGVDEATARLERRKFAAEFTTRQLFDAMNTPIGERFIVLAVVKRLNADLNDAQLEDITTKVCNVPRLMVAWESCQTIPPELQARLDAIKEAVSKGADGDEGDEQGADFPASSQT